MVGAVLNKLAFGKVFPPAFGVLRIFRGAGNLVGLELFGLDVEIPHLGAGGIRAVT